MQVTIQLTYEETIQDARHPAASPSVNLAFRHPPHTNGASASAVRPRAHAPLARRDGHRRRSPTALRHAKHGAALRDASSAARVAANSWDGMVNA